MYWKYFHALFVQHSSTFSLLIAKHSYNRQVILIRSRVVTSALTQWWPAALLTPLTPFWVENIPTCLPPLTVLAMHFLQTQMTCQMFVVFHSSEIVRWGRQPLKRLQIICLPFMGFILPDLLPWCPFLLTIDQSWVIVDTPTLNSFDRNKLLNNKQHLLENRL